MLEVKNLLVSAEEARDLGLIPKSGRSPGGRHGNLLQSSCLESPMDREAWWAEVYRIANSWTWLQWLKWHDLARTHAHTLLYYNLPAKSEFSFCYSTIYIYIWYNFKSKILWRDKKHWRNVLKLFFKYMCICIYEERERRKDKQSHTWLL